MLVFRGVPIPVIAQSQVLVPLNSPAVNTPGSPDSHVSANEFNYCVGEAMKHCKPTYNLVVVLTNLATYRT